jgi:FKBP-type peptidyl-prolyl cis-trans isomerase 2
MMIKKGDTIKVDYTGTFDDGTVFDSSQSHGQPLEFKVGSGQLIAGFDNAVIGMKKDQEKQIKLQPAEAYGEHNPKMIQKVPKEHFPKEQAPKKGMMLAVGFPDGRKLPALITDVTEKEITLDFNHPMAGKVLNFRIKVVDIKPC